MLFLIELIVFVFEYKYEQIRNEKDCKISIWIECIGWDQLEKKILILINQKFETKTGGPMSHSLQIFAVFSCDLHRSAGGQEEGDIIHGAAG